MNVLARSGRGREAAVALSVDGRVVSAAMEESVPNAATFCLAAAGLSQADLTAVVTVDDGRNLTPSLADALTAQLFAPSAGAVLVAGPDGLAAFERGPDGALAPRPDIPGADGLAASARSLANLLGLEGRDAYAALDDLSHGADPIYLDTVAPSFTWANGARSPVVTAAGEADLRALAVRVAGEHADRLADASSLNARVHDVRRGLAASFVARLAQLTARAIEWTADAAKGGPVAAGGACFGNPRFNTELHSFGAAGLQVAPVPGPAGRVLGAAGGRLDTLALGPAFDDEAVKRVLDNCRLDSIYEPDWARLIARVSRLLASGKVVAWMQGPMAFGPRPFGTRSILADPSQRYARHNVNEYLRARPAGDPLPLVFAPSQAAECLEGDAASTAARDAVVRPGRRAGLAAALDGRHRARVSAPSSLVEPRLCDLLEHHASATGTPALIELPLAAAGDPIACTPRDAVRTMFSSAIDALVVGRFLLMKDYWLLRGEK